MQINRLFEMIYLLLEHKRMTARDLAERFEVSERTIYRDVEILSSGGIPIYASKGKGGGISLMDGYVLNKSVLSEQEQKEILYALQGLSAARVPGTGDVLGKLGTIFRKTESNWIEVDFSGWGSGPEEREHFEILKKAILEERDIRFVYYSSYGERSERNVFPRKLVFKNSSWYLSAYCYLRGDERLFKIARMEDITIGEEPQKDRQNEIGYSIQDPYFSKELKEGVIEGTDIGNQTRKREFVWLTLHFMPEMAFRIYETFDRKCVEKQEDGSFIVTIGYPEDEWVYSFLLSFGEKVKVVSPPHIQKILKTKAEAISRLYPEII